MVARRLGVSIETRLRRCDASIREQERRVSGNYPEIAAVRKLGDRDLIRDQ